MGGSKPYLVLLPKYLFKQYTHGRALHKRRLLPEVEYLKVG